jgi:hypothetical protein
MFKVDAPLRVLQSLSARKPAGKRTMDDVSTPLAETPTAAVDKIKVFLKFSGDLANIEAAGFEIRSTIGNIATGRVSLDRLDDIAALPNVTKIEFSQPLDAELDNAIPDIHADVAHNLGHRGRGVIVGIVDFGIDFTHPSFVNADGTSRILFIWNHRIEPTADAENHPQGYDYGVEYDRSDIEKALASNDPNALVRCDQEAGLRWPAPRHAHNGDRGGERRRDLKSQGPGSGAGSRHRFRLPEGGGRQKARRFATSRGREDRATHQRRLGRCIGGRRLHLQGGGPAEQAGGGQSEHGRHPWPS